MKLAEALILRSDYQKRIEQLRERLERSAKVQEGEQPPEDPQVLLEELEQLYGKLEIIIQRINRTNASIRFDEEMSLTDALAKRDILGAKRSALAELIEEASVKHARYSRSEVKFFPTIDIAGTQKKMDTYAIQYRELDTRIQAINWLTDVKE